VRGPSTDAEVPAWWRRLGLPGLADVHVHFLPPPVMTRVWEHFDAAGPLLGRPWPINYRGGDDERAATLRELGVRWHGALPYAHRPGIAAYLNEWAADFAGRTPGCLRCATLYPEPGVVDEVSRRLGDGVQLFKVHVQVGDFDVRDPLLDPVWGLLAEAGTPVVVHAGSGPVPNRHTGPEPMAELLARHPRLCAIIAHLGAPEYEEFVGLAEQSEHVHLDTTMAFTDFFEADAPVPRSLLPRLLDLADRILLGSDFPNIPYAYAHQLDALDRLELGDDWLRAVCWHNPVRLLGLDPGVPARAFETESQSEDIDGPMLKE
jgi:predicted TIM-barrel fold metal-dependent hydrolase